ncbi:MAG: nucleotidyltransferase domain-containing protein [Deltaproteobacteria bacterium]|nr:nucleotidyltransferase domain-containing protein [Deltaproteobacteria bacterium]
MFKLFAKPLSRADQDAIVSAKLVWILSQVNPTRVILFGSAASYQMTDASDIDLILTFASIEERDSSRVMLFKSRPKDDWPHDLLLLTEEEFAQSVAKGGGAAYLASQEGRVLYQSGGNHESA